MSIFKDKKKLMLVYDPKDELALNYFKKLIETDDDIENHKIIGSEDDTVSVIGWTEKVYLDNKKKGNITNKIIFLDDAVKGVDKVAPIMDVKFNKYGITYGFAGNQAVISIDESQIKNESTYAEMEEYFTNYYKLKLFEGKDIDSIKNEELDLDELFVEAWGAKPKYLNYGDAKKRKIIAIIVTASYPIIGIPFIVGAVKQNRKLRDAMFIFAINMFYLEELDAFMKS